MAKIKVQGKVGDYKKLRTTVPIGYKQNRSAMAIEAKVENKPQLLRKLRSTFASGLLIPGTLGTQAQYVLKLLFDCFDKAGTVQEGLVGDMLWGFEQSTPPVPPQFTIDGLTELEAKGYVKFQAKDGSYTTFQSDLITGAWLRYMPKLLEMVYEPGH